MVCIICMGLIGNLFEEKYTYIEFSASKQT